MTGLVGPCTARISGEAGTTRRRDAPWKHRNPPQTHTLTAMTIATAAASGDEGDKDYELRISRLTVDKLGVKLYDRVSAVVAELVANAYDADAEKVTVRLPLATQLDKPPSEDEGWSVIVEDDGHGLTPAEAREHYLVVGKDRRKDGGAGPVSRQLKRPVMGRKGIGKLAPFGICKRIEVVSSGGPETDQGYLTSHFLLDFDDIIGEDTDKPVKLDKGDLDRTYQPKSGTTITLTDFLAKRVPTQAVFMRQLERRFALAAPDFTVCVVDTRQPDSDPLTMATFAVETMEGTRIDLSTRPVQLDGGGELPVKGWIGMAAEAYKDEEVAGVRIYARGKIVATTRDFEQPAGYTGEFTTRSYLVGEVHADWLDDDTGDDLVRTDRQSILWESERGNALRQWGAELTKEIGRRSRGPRRLIVKKKFRTVAKLKERAEAMYTDAAVVQMALDLGDQIGAFAAEDELEDEDYVNGLAGVILSAAPHQALIKAFQDFRAQVSGGDAPSLESLSDLFAKSRVAEAASYAQLAEERVGVLDRLDLVVFDSKRDEAALQRIITEAPWLIQPDWTVLTANQSLKTFKTAFEHYLKTHHGLDTELAIEWSGKRPDFVLAAVGGMLHLVEIKASGHKLDDEDFVRLYRYVDALTSFFAVNKDMAAEFSRGWRIDLVVDGVNLKPGPNRRAYEDTVRDRQVEQMTWNDFRSRARRANEAFLEVRDAAKKLAKDGTA